MVIGWIKSCKIIGLRWIYIFKYNIRRLEKYLKRKR